MIIRETTLDDAPEVMRHRRFMFRDMGFRDEAALDAMQASSGPYIVARVKDGTYRGWFAQTSDGKIAGGGGVLLYPWVSNPRDSNPMRAYLLNVYVYQEFRRQGLARRLMQVMVDWCRAQGFSTVWLHASDEGRALYESMGFAATNEMKLVFDSQTLPVKDDRMTMKSQKVRVAAIQVAPVYLDLAASVRKALKLMQEAARKGAKIVAFGETWLPGYPAWLDCCPDAALWNHPPVKKVFARLRENSVTVPGKEIALLARTARKLGITVVIGVNERVDSGPGNGTLYNSLLTFTPDGRVANHHRKLVPTYTERMVWGQGDGSGLDAVETPHGRVGGLICWEHWMPLARQAMHNSGEHIHAAVWPTAHDLHHLASRHYAFEGRCFVICVGLVMPASDLPRELQRPARTNGKAPRFVCRGGSAIFAPDGHTVAGPVYDRETILIADLDLAEIDQEKMTLDVSGHYARPDVFEFGIRPRCVTSSR